MTTATRNAKPRGLGLLLLAAFVALATLIGGAGTSSAATGSHAGNRVGASTLTVATIVGATDGITAGQRLGQALPQAEVVVATGVAAKTVASPGARFIANSVGDVLDVSRVTIPEGKFGYLLKNPSKSGVFADSMGFDQAGLDAALRNHLTSNFGSASPSVAMTGGGSKFTVRGAMTGPSGQSWNITTAWGVDVDGTVRLITATP